MTLIEAIKSGKGFKRPIWNCYVNANPNDEETFSIHSILANDYELEEKTVTITEAEFDEAYHAARYSDNKGFGSSYNDFLYTIKKRLGF